MPGISAQLRSKLEDERGKKVVFVSHCILNENARYLGGAFAPGMMPGIAAAIEARGWGIVQMPCPEQGAWGGPLKKYMWLSFGIRGKALYKAAFILVPLFAAYTRIAFRSYARRVASQIRDYRRSGLEVVGIIGIDGSPSCGVSRRLDMKRSFAFLSSLSLEGLDRRTMNERMYAECAESGKGIFMEEIERALGSDEARLPWLSFDLSDEMRGKAMEL